MAEDLRAAQRIPGSSSGNRPLILVVEDEEDIRDLVRFTLEQDGCVVRTAADGEGAMTAIRSQRPALVVLDLMLPRMSGLEVCRRLRGDAATARLPVLVLTAKGSEADRVVGLELGADDYVVKPFSPRELAARVRALLRRAYGEEREGAPNVYEKGPLRIDFDSHEVWVDGRAVELSRREFDLLRFFVNSPNRVYDRLQILDLVWGDDVTVGPRTVDVHVRRLRQSIESDDANPRLILTVRGVGYKFDTRGLDAAATKEQV